MIALAYFLCLFAQQQGIERVVAEADIPAFVAYNSAVALQAQNRVVEAIIAYQGVIGLKPNLAEAHNNLGNLLHASQDHKGAIAHYELALSTADNDQTMKASALNNIGHLHQMRAGKNQKLVQQAMSNFKRALEHDPLHLDALYNLGNGFYALNQYQDAIRVFKQVLERDPMHPGANMNLGNVYLTAGNNVLAIEYSQSILSAPDERIPLRDKLGALNNMGQVLRLEGQASKALQIHLQALALSPSDTMSLMNVITAHRTLCSWQDIDELRGKILATVKTHLENAAGKNKYTKNNKSASSASSVPGVANTDKNGDSEDSEGLEGENENAIPLLPYDSLLMPLDAELQLRVAKAQSGPWNAGRW